MSRCYNCRDKQTTINRLCDERNEANRLRDVSKEDAVRARNELVVSQTELTAAKYEADKTIIANAAQRSEIRSLRGKLERERSVNRANRG